MHLELIRNNSHYANGVKRPRSAQLERIKIRVAYYWVPTIGAVLMGWGMVEIKKLVLKPLASALIFSVGVTRFELATTRPQTRTLNRAELHPEIIGLIKTNRYRGEALLLRLHSCKYLHSLLAFQAGVLD